MTRSPRAPRLLAALWLGLAILAAGLLAVPAHAADKDQGIVDMEARLEPADLGPGGSGTLVVRVAPLDKDVHDLPGFHFLYAKGELALKVDGLEAQGVTYDLDRKTTTDPVEIEEYGTKKTVWTEPFEIRVPVKLGDDVADGTRIGLAVTYHGCLFEIACYPEHEDQEAFVVLGGAEETAEPTASDPIADAGGSVEIAWDEDKQAVIITFTPEFLHWMYGPGAKTGLPIEVKPVEAEGVTWGPWELGAPEKIEDVHQVVIPVERDEAAKRVEVEVSFQACNDMGCLNQVPGRLSIAWPGAEAAPEPVDAEPAPKGEVLFPIIENDDLGGDIAGAEDESSLVQKYMQENTALGLGMIFLFGLLLAFTPCVLPIIPITVSVITGGNADIPKKRLSMLLLMYVLGLSLAFATLGTVAAAAGGSVSALFALPATQWGIAILFILLAFSMIGVYELQPPAWLMKLQGGAQKRSGSIIGAFMFGVLGAIIASPCTAPAVAGMLIVTANTGSLPLGFIMFFMLGLGMGAVFYAAGALNFLMRPGPWMVWVRYGFGVMLWGMALYYLYGKGLIPPTALWVMGGVVSALAAYGIYWHLTTKEGEEKGPARKRGLQVAATWVAATVLIFFISERTTGDWTKVKDRDHLQRLVKEATDQGKPVVVDFWATWCATCVEYDELIEENEELNKLFSRVRKLKVDVGNNPNHKDIRDALGMGKEAQGQPYMVMIDSQGRIRKAADVTGWYGDDENGVNMLKARLAVILGEDAKKDPAAAGQAPAKVDTGDVGTR